MDVWLAARAVLAACLVAACGQAALGGPAGTPMVDPRAGGGWRTDMAFGDVSRSKVSADAADRGTLKVDLAYDAPGVNHLLAAHDVRLDLSGAESISFEVRGTGDPVDIYLYLFDSQGRLTDFGPRSGIPDGHTGHRDWFRCTIDLVGGRHRGERSADMADIRRVGFFLWGEGRKRGAAWFRDLSYRDAPSSVAVSPAVVTPNGDGLNDTAAVRILAPRGSTATVEVLDERGRLVDALARDAAPHGRVLTVSWAAQRGGRPVSPGVYTVRARFVGGQPAELASRVTVARQRPWKEPAYRTRPFFPIGVWFEGSPRNARYPTDAEGARRYYERCFTDLQAHGFNAIVVPNCPEALWETLLQVADRHGIQVGLEIESLRQMVVGSTPPTEAQVLAEAKRVVGKIGRYRSLWRYQISDEPPMSVLQNWVLVQRVLASADPTRPAFSCFSWAGGISAVRKRTSLPEACYDIYPLAPETPRQSIGDFLDELKEFSTASAGLPQYVVLQDFAEEQGGWKRRAPTAEELRSMTYLSLANGAEGVFYFIYQGGEGTDSMVDPDGKPRHLYAPTVALAQEMKPLAPLLLSLKADGEMEGTDVRVGRFHDTRGRSVLAVASARPDRPETARIAVSGSTEWKDAVTGQRFQAAGGVLTVALAPGHGRVLVPDGAAR